MYEVDFIAVGDGASSGDAIAMRFTRPDGNLAHCIIDGGFATSGDQIVEHVKQHYGVDEIDFAILTHPDKDHIGGMGVVLRELKVATLLAHNIGAHGGGPLPAAKAVADLMTVAAAQGTVVVEPFAGDHAFDGALRILGPSEEYYETLVEEQVQIETSGGGARVLSTARSIGKRFLNLLPPEVIFTDGEGTSPRNNTSVVTMVEVDGHRLLFTGDAGVPALHQACDYLETSGAGLVPPQVVQIPHHGSKRNASSSLLDRLLGPSGQNQTRDAVVSVSAEADDKHPSARVVNAYSRRGHNVCQTAGQTICCNHNAAPRPGWGPVIPFGPMDESLEED